MPPPEEKRDPRLRGNDEEDDTTISTLPSTVPVKPRHDGWSPERQRDFLVSLARCGVVRDAAAFVGIRRESAYRLRRRPDAIAFARAWDAALILSRDLHEDEVHARALHGWRETIWYHGEEAGERDRYSPQLALAALGRLDRKVEGLDLAGNVARTAAGHFDELVECIGEDGDASALLAEEDAAAEMPHFGARADSEVSDGELIERIEMHHRVREIRAMDPGEIDISDLDPADLETGASDDWTDEQWARADRSGFLDRCGFADDWEEEEEDGDTGEGGDDGDGEDDPGRNIFALKRV